MTLEKKTLAITLICLVFVVGSIIPYRWLSLNDSQLLISKESLESSQRELRALKKNVDSFNRSASIVANDKQLQKEYYEKNMAYNNQFKREDVKQIDDLLHTLYKRDDFFELEELSLKHSISNVKDQKPRIKFVIKGDKHLVNE